MNKIAEEILSYYGVAERIESDTIEHYGMPRRSGRYPYGSGEDPYQHARDFLGRVDELRKQGKTILLVSHNSEDIKLLCDDIYEMDKGKIQ